VKERLAYFQKKRDEKKANPEEVRLPSHLEDLNHCCADVCH
jgi:hypothetical protein